MATLNTKTFTGAVQDFAAAVEARAAGLIDFSVGSLMRAFSEAQAAVALWLQAEILKVLALTRLATSNGADADSFIADFFGPFADGTPAAFERLGAEGSVGQLSFARITTTAQGVVPVGATVGTLDGSQKVVVTLDATNPAFNAGLNAYVLAIGVASVTVPAAALTIGAASNVLPNTLTVITSSIPGIDTVTNAAAFVGGTDAETTPALIVRFAQQILSLREATVTAILYYAGRARSGLRLKNVEGVNPDGTTHKGFFYVVVDDGTGSPTTDLLNSVSAMVDAHRANGIEFAVIAPTVVTANVLFGLTSSLANPAPDKAAAVAAVQAYINNLDIGATLFWSRLFQIAYNASPTITDIVGLTINAGTSDIPAAVPHVVKAGTVAST